MSQCITDSLCHIENRRHLRTVTLLKRSMLDAQDNTLVLKQLFAERQVPRAITRRIPVAQNIPDPIVDCRTFREHMFQGDAVYVRFDKVESSQNDGAVQSSLSLDFGLRTSVVKIGAGV